MQTPYGVRTYARGILRGLDLCLAWDSRPSNNPGPCKAAPLPHLVCGVMYTRTLRSTRTVVPCPLRLVTRSLSTHWTHPTSSAARAKSMRENSHDEAGPRKATRDTLTLMGTCPRLLSVVSFEVPPRSDRHGHHVALTVSPRPSVRNPFALCTHSSIPSLCLSSAVSACSRL